MKTFVTESELYQNNPIETINTDLFTVVFKEFEQDYFLCMIISHTGLYTDQVIILLSKMIFIAFILHFGYRK